MKSALYGITDVICYCKRYTKEGLTETAFMIKRKIIPFKMDFVAIISHSFNVSYEADA